MLYKELIHAFMLLLFVLRILRGMIENNKSQSLDTCCTTLRLVTSSALLWLLVLMTGQDITGKTPLMKATRNGKLEAVKRLLAAGCSVSVRDRNSDTALHFAARHGNARLLSALITASAADINMQVASLSCEVAACFSPQNSFLGLRLLFLAHG